MLGFHETGLTYVFWFFTTDCTAGIWKDYVPSRGYKPANQPSHNSRTYIDASNIICTLWFSRFVTSLLILSKMKSLNSSFNENIVV